MQVVTKTEIKEYPLLSRGKVRDIYEIDSETLLIVTTDRMSAFDVILDKPIPYKGVVLNQLTLFWMDKFRDIIPNHMRESRVERFPALLQGYKPMLEGRSVLVRKAAPLPVECVVRGALAGSGWKDYQAAGKVCGQTLPAGLLECQILDAPIFTPSTKAALGSHDENITPAEAEKLLGQAVYSKVRDASLAIFKAGRDYARDLGIIIADTKFEFGLVQGQVILIDEVLTPDSSRFWPRAGYAPGKSQPSFDKQLLRDWLETRPWNKKAPAPPLSAEIVEQSQERYLDAYRRLTGKSLII